MSDTGKMIALIKALAPAPEIDPEEVKADVEEWLDDHPEATTTVQDGAITKAKLNADLKAEIEKKADNDGLYEQMTVGNAEQLVATVGVEDKVPYNFRTAGGTADIGDRMVDKLVGGTVAWNQMVKNADFSSGETGFENWTFNGTATASNGIVTWETPGYYANFYQQQIYATVGHKYLVSVALKTTERFSLNYNDQQIIYMETGNGNWTHYAKVISVSSVDSNEQRFRFMCTTVDGATTDILLRNPQIIDLTQMFGPTIADYIYSLETNTAGAGVAWFRKLFPKDYYAYNPGELMSVKAAAHKTVGFNAWDITKDVEGKTINGNGTIINSSSFAVSDYIKVVPSATYYLRKVAPSANAMCIAYYDAAKNLISCSYINASENTDASGTKTMPSNAHYVRICRRRVTTDSCFNLSWDGERDGEYEAYDEHTYALDTDLELRGIPALDENNKLYYDGDEYKSDGTVTRKYGVVDLGTLTWNKSQSGLFFTTISDANTNIDTNHAAPIISALYSAIDSQSITGPDGANPSPNMTMALNGARVLYINNTGFSDVGEFKTAMSNVLLVYPLQTPTTESADPYQNPQIVDDFGTEEYIDAGVTASTPTRDVAIPVGHETTYQANLRAKLEMAPESPDGDGDYIVRQTNGQNEYVELVIPTELPTAPTTDGNYVLKCTVSNGTAVYTWEVQS